MRPPLTDRQREVFTFILKHWQLKQRCPSLREIAKGELDGKRFMKPRSQSCGVHKVIERIVERGWLVTERFGSSTYWRVPEDLANE